MLSTYSKFRKYRLHLHYPGQSGSLYITNTLKAFAESLIGIFIPIYIFKLTNLPQIAHSPVVSSIMWVLIYYLLRSFIILSAIGFITNFVFGRIHFKLSIFFSNLLLAFALFLMSNANINPALLILSVIPIGFATPLYWIPYHILFLRKNASKDGHYGKKFGKRMLFGNTAAALGPFIGGTVITFLGFNTLFYLGILILLFSALPILLSVKEHKHGKHNARHIFMKTIKNKAYLQDTIAMGSEASDSILYSIFWPIMMFIVLASFEKVGTITSISIAMSSVVSILVGIYIDKENSRTIHKIGVSLNSLLYLPRAFVTSPIPVYMIDIADRINGALYGIPIISKMYEHANKAHHDSEFIIYRDIIVHISIILVVGISMFLVNILPRWQLVFIFISLVSPFAYLINKSPKEDQK